MAAILSPHNDALQRAAQIITQGGLVAFPTETVYGLGADAFNAAAVARIFEVKRRPRFDPLIVHVADVNDLERVCRHVPPQAHLLIKRFWPGPLTLVLPKSEAVPDIVTSGLDTVAVRMPAHPVALNLLQHAGVPIAAPSANLFGFLSPTTAEHVATQLGSAIELVLDGGQCPIGVESTIIALSDPPTLLRPGGIPVEDIEAVLGKVHVVPPGDVPQAPGQLAQHYAPRTRLKILPIEQIPREDQGSRIGLLALRPVSAPPSFAVVEMLTNTGDLREAAANLFACLHRLDAAGLDIIYAEPVPTIGIGKAIMDRLQKAEGVSHAKIL